MILAESQQQLNCTYADEVFKGSPFHPILAEYLRHCRLLNASNHRECGLCKRAVAKLLNLPKQLGYAWLTCDCRANAFCHDEQANVEQCLQHAVTTIAAQTSPISCDLARYRCDVDSSCSTRLKPFEECVNYFHFNNSSVACEYRDYCSYIAKQFWQHNKTQQMRDCLCPDATRAECWHLQVDMTSHASRLSGVNCLVAIFFLFQSTLLALSRWRNNACVICRIRCDHSGERWWKA